MAKVVSYRPISREIKKAQSQLRKLRTGASKSARKVIDLHIRGLNTVDAALKPHKLVLKPHGTKMDKPHSMAMKPHVTKLKPHVTKMAMKPHSP